MARHLGHSSIETTQASAEWADDRPKRALSGVSSDSSRSICIARKE